jgi:hypothetical protein
MDTITTLHPPTTPSRLPAATVRAAFVALLARDLTVLRKRPGDFIARTIVQPLLFVFRARLRQSQDRPGSLR